MRKFFSKYLPASLVLVFLAIILWTCGGGGGGGGTTSGPTGTITGSVSGTTVIAVNESGTIVASDDTTGKTPDANGNFPFTLTGIPVGDKVCVFLLTNGGMYPLYYDSDGDSIPDTNVFSLASAVDVDLGFVGIGQEGRAIPENDPTDTADVSAESEDTTIPDSINAPDTSGLSLSQLLNEGFDALRDGLVLRAKTYFKAAEALAGSSVSNDADTARFFYALTRVASLGFDTYSDGDNADAIDHLGDILDGFGCDPAGTKRSNFDALSCPETLPSDSPRGGELQGFLTDVVRTELGNAIANLDAVSASFQRTENFEGESIEFDFGDALFARSAFKASIAKILLQSAYNLDADIDAETNLPVNSTEEFLFYNPDVLALSPGSGSALADLKTFWAGAADDLSAAIDQIQGETDDQNDDFINLLGTTSGEITQAKADIADFKASLDNPTLILDNDADLFNDFTLDISQFLAGLDFRSPSLLPPFSGGDVSGLFPDPTFNGIIGPEVDLNEDTNPADGIPDIFQSAPAAIQLRTFHVIQLIDDELGNKKYDYRFEVRDMYGGMLTDPGLIQDVRIFEYPSRNEIALSGTWNPYHSDNLYHDPDGSGGNPPSPYTWNDVRGVLDVPVGSLGEGFYRGVVTDSWHQQHGTWLYYQAPTEVDKVQESSMSVAYGNGITLSWANPTNIDPATHFIRLYVASTVDSSGDGFNDALLMVTLPATAESYMIPAAEVTRLSGFSSLYWFVQIRERLSNVSNPDGSVQTCDVYRNSGQTQTLLIAPIQLGGYSVIQLNDDVLGNKEHNFMIEVHNIDGSMLTDPGLIQDVRIFEYPSMNEIPISGPWNLWYAPQYYTDSDGNGGNPPSPYNWSDVRGVLNVPVGSLGEGFYRGVVTDSSGQQHGTWLYYQAPTEIGKVQASSMSVTDNGNGTVTLSWTTPTNFDPAKNNKRLYLSSTVDSTLLSANVLATDDSYTIPAAEVTRLGGFSSLYWYVQIRERLYNVPNPDATVKTYDVYRNSGQTQTVN